MAAKPAYKLLASSSTLEGLTKLVNQYWMSTSWTVDADTLELNNPKVATPEGVRIVKTKGRYRFERRVTV